MKKLITKFWGVALVVIMLTTLFVGTAAPVSAANYAWASSTAIPTAASGVLSPPAFGIVAVAQSGSTIYAIGQNGTNSYLYKSADGGATWAAQVTGITQNATSNWAYIAVAPDDPKYVVIVDTTDADAVWFSETGGTLFSRLAASTVVVNIKSIDISPLTTVRYIAIGGNNGAGAGNVATWQLGLASPGWVSRALAGNSDVFAIAFSPNFAADNGLIAVSNNNTFDTVASVFSFNTGLGWNPPGYDFPRTLIANGGAATNITKATITLDPNFYLGDLSLQVGFVAVASTNTTAGGIYRFDSTALMTQIYAAQSVNNVAWDGTNLMAAPYDLAAGGAITILRCANALSTIPAFVPSSALKTPGTGTLPLVMFNGGVGYAFSQGTNSAIAKSTDLGKSFNGFALVRSNFNDIKDFWVSPDGTRMYVVTYDGQDVNLWRRDGTTWQRVFVLASPVALQRTWLVRADADTPDTVFLGNKGQTIMYKSTDAGEAAWTIRGASALIADFAVQDANTVYAVSSADAFIYKSTTGAFTWTAITAAYLGGTGYSINLLADNSLVVGTNAGGVAYSNDGATFTTCFSATDALTAGNTVVTATGTATGDTIFAGSAGGMLAKWTIGTSTSWGVATASTFNQPIVGIAYADGILYALNDTANATYRWITPASSITATFLSDTKTTAAVADQTNIVNALKLTSGSNVLWARDSFATIDDLITYTDPLVGANAIPTPTYPINGTIIPVNSLNGQTNPFNFMWNVPAAPAPQAGYAFNVEVYLDEAGTIPYAGSPTVVVSPLSYTTGVVASGAFIGTPGITYYWRTRVASDKPELGPWSAMASFAVQQLQAIVPVLSSPANGSSILTTQTAAFSWNPIGGATSYKFDLSTDPTFATTVYTTTTASAGTSLPVTIKLEAGKTYFWRVKTLTPAEGEYSTVANFSVAAPAATTTVPVITPTITVQLPTPTVTTVTVVPPPTENTTVNPSYIWAIIIIGAVLVIAVIVLIVRTRRSV